MDLFKAFYTIDGDFGRRDADDGAVGFMKGVDEVDSFSGQD